MNLKGATGYMSKLAAKLDLPRLKIKVDEIDVGKLKNRRRQIIPVWAPWCKHLFCHHYFISTFDFISKYFKQWSEEEIN